jgi:hypothetical protein
MGGKWRLDREKERERFTRWASELGIDFDSRAFDDLVDFNGLRATVAELELGFLAVQRGETYSTMGLKTVS